MIGCAMVTGDPDHVAPGKPKQQDTIGFLRLRAWAASAASTLSESIVMVDDFQVPGESGYGYDDYGSGKALTSEYIALSCQKFNLVRFYPAISAREETEA